MVLDIMLPGEIDGFTVCSKIREDSIHIFLSPARKLIRRVSSKALISVLMIISRNHTI